MVVKKLKSIVLTFNRDDDIFRTRQIQENELPW